MNKQKTSIRLSPSIITYFHTLAKHSGLRYQTLINDALLDCITRKWHPLAIWQKAQLKESIKLKKLLNIR